MTYTLLFRCDFRHLYLTFMTFLFTNFSKTLEFFVNHTQVFDTWTREIFGRRSWHLCRCISKFLAVGRSIFSQKWVFFEIFEIFLPRPPQKSFFIAFYYQISQKISKKEVNFFFSILCPLDGWIPPKISLTWAPLFTLIWALNLVWAYRTTV